MSDDDLLRRLRGFNTPDRTLDYQREAAQAIHDAADEIERLQLCMKEAAHGFAEHSDNQQAEIERLRTENAGLHELLMQAWANLDPEDKPELTSSIEQIAVNCGNDLCKRLHEAEADAERLAEAIRAWSDCVHGSEDGLRAALAAHEEAKK